METVVRAAIIYVFLLITMRAVGRKELAGMSAFDLVLLVVIGDLVQQGITQQDTSLTAAMLAVSTIAVLVVTMSFLSYRWRRTGPVLQGIPVVVVRHGRVIPEALKVERLSRDDVDEAARQQGIGDLADVEVGVLEADGKFAFILGREKRQQQGDEESPAA
jgi:uncharacterized membrane protein YcaP (DUF421 family)